MSLFEFKNYKKYVNDRIKMMPHRGRGQYLKLSKFLAVNSVTVSQIFNGPRDLTPEQALGVSEFFGLSDIETKYFRLLVDFERAGTALLKQVLRKEIEVVASDAQELKNRIPQNTQLTDEVKAIFYSQWYYSGIRLLSSLPGVHSVDKISDQFNLPTKTVSDVINFLLETGLCVQENNKLKMGASSTHIGSTHPLVTRHHANWRLKALSQMNTTSSEELFFTMPCSVSEKSIPLIRKKILEAIDEVVKVVDSDKEEKLACLNIDWFKF